MASFNKFGNDLYTGERSFNIVGRRKIWFGIAVIMILAAIVIPILKGGFVFGIDFRGGSQFEITKTSQLNQTLAIQSVLAVDPNTNPTVTIVGGNSVQIQTDQVSSAESDKIQVALAKVYNVPTKEVTTSFIGATWGQDITRQAITGLVAFVVLAAIVMALYFRTWKMSLAAIVALMHDLVITAGVYGILGFEVTPAAVIGFLTILGYSLYDTVVVFDKIRENTRRDGPESGRTFGESVNYAVNQTLVRSINTSVVALLPVAAILFIGALLLGAGTLRDISLALFIGILAGTYSTIFIAAPLYAQLRSGEDKVMKQDKRTVANRQASLVK
jgi:preprotein translocase subunit SecF